MKYVAIIAIASICAGSPSHASCQIIDPELQGSYSGTCNQAGFADGLGEARSETARYKGYFKNGQKHGQGVKLWLKTGDQYTGEFLNDYRHGWGMYSWGDNSPWAGQSHEGQYLKDLREGYGVYFWPNGDKFAGQWKAGLRLGESYMEVRKRKASELAAAASAIATQLCLFRKEGLIAQTLIQGRVVSIDPQGTTVETSDLAGNKIALKVSAEQLGANWTPCAPDTPSSSR